MKIFSNKWVKSYMKWLGNRATQAAQIRPQSLRMPTMNPFDNIHTNDRRDRREQLRRKNHK
jgi:hypothetical protein